MTNENQKLEVCKEYLEAILEVSKADNGCVIASWDEKRTEIHDQIINLFDCDPVKLQTITGSLDVWIALPDTYEKSDIRYFSKRLHDLLNSEFFTNADWGAIREMHKKLSALYLEDIDFIGWIPSLTNES